MLDIGLYRENESIAVRELENWRIRSRHALDVFEKANFPVRVDNIAKLRQIISTMQEGAIEAVVNEMCGLSNAECDLLLEVLQKSIEFQLQMFPNKEPILILDNFLHALNFYTKIKLLNPKKILEIGPGCGSLSYFFSKLDDAIYHQIEVCESFYMLNHYQNMFLFQNRFKQHAVSLLKADVNFFVRDGLKPLIFNKKAKIEQTRNIKCEQFPWWQIDLVRQKNAFYDLAISNANLLEFSKEALLDYLELISITLSDSGYFIVNCFGAQNSTTFEDVLSSIYNAKLAPLYISHSSLHEQISFTPPQKNRSLVIGPIGVLGSALLECLNKNDFSQIYAVDDMKAGQIINGITVISSNDAQKISTDYYIASTEHTNIRLKFEELFKAIAKTDANKYIHRPAKGWGVFINQHHILFDKYYKKENFKNVFNSCEDIVNSMFDFKEKQDVVDMLSIIENTVFKV